MGKIINLKGKRFGRLEVLDCVGLNNRNDSMWLCHCDCGSEKVINGRQLRYGYSVSCGCNKAEKASKRMKTHGMSETPLYDVWCSMKARCNRSSCKDYPNYGGRGISVCEEWTIFPAFYAWAMASGYKEHLTIDRKNVNGNYEPSNCQWIPNCEQSYNRRISRKVEYGGETHSVMEWSNILGIKYNSLKTYVNRGLSLGEILEKRGGRNHEISLIHSLSR